MTSMAIGFSVMISVATAAAAAAAMNIIVFRINIFNRPTRHTDSTATTTSVPTITSTRSSSAVVFPVSVELTSSAARATSPGRRRPTARAIADPSVVKVQRIVRTKVIVQDAVVVDAGNLVAVDKVERKWRRKQVKGQEHKSVQHEMKHEAGPD